MAKENKENKWQRVYNDLDSMHSNRAFMQNYIHSNEQIFETSLNMLEGQDFEKIVNETKQHIINEIKKHINFYSTVERKLVVLTNSKMNGAKLPNKFKDIHELLEETRKQWKDSLKGSLAANQVELKKLQTIIRTNQNSKSSYYNWVSTKESNKRAIKNFELIQKAIVKLISDNKRKLIGMINGKTIKSGPKKTEFLRIIAGWVENLKEKGVNIENRDWKSVFSKLPQEEILTFFNMLGGRDPSRIGGSAFEEEIQEIIDRRLKRMEKASKNNEEVKDGDLIGYLLTGGVPISKKDALAGAKLATKNVTDVISSQVTVRNKTVNVGISAKMKYSNWLFGNRYTTENTGDYLNILAPEQRYIISYLRGNFTALGEVQGRDKFFNLEAELATIFGITRFLNESLLKIDEKDTISVATVFLFTQDKIFLVSDMLKYIVNGLEESSFSKNRITGIKGFEGKAKAEISKPLTNTETEELKKLKKGVISWFGNDITYSKILGNKKVRSFLNGVNEVARKNSIINVAYNFDINILK